MPPSRAKGPEQPIRTFDEAFADHKLTPAERNALVWHLAMFRARKTVEALSVPDYGTVNEQAIARLGYDYTKILRSES